MKSFLVLILLLFSSVVFALQGEGNEVRKINGKDFIVYDVQSGDTWFAIARKFNISYSELRVANKESDDKLTKGEKILVPGDRLKPNDAFYNKNYTDKKENASNKLSTDKIHIVEKSQTLFSISRLYNVSVEQIRQWNNLGSNSISIGQKIIVGKGSKETSVNLAPEVKPTIKTEEIKSTEPEVIVPPKNEKTEEPKTVIDVPVEPNELNKYPNSETKKINDTIGENVAFASGRIEVIENGTAVWVDEDDNNSDKYFAHHRTAQIGTIIRVLNKSNSRKIYVKVTGILSDSPENEGAIIRLSKASAEKLGALEKKFDVNLLYGRNKN